MKTVRVLVADIDFVDVVLPDSVPFPALGDDVDWMVNATANSQGFLNLQLRADWPAAPPRAVKSA